MLLSPSEYFEIPTQRGLTTQPKCLPPIYSDKIHSQVGAKAAKVVFHHRETFTTFKSQLK